MIRPPKYAERFLDWILKQELTEEVLGDLEEKFYQSLEEGTLFKARANYWFQTFNYLRPFALRNNLITNLNPFFMYRHNIKISFRTLWRDKGFSLINIGGLALGMAVAILIGLWTWDEFNYNKNYENYDQIAQVMQNQTFNGKVETWNSQALQLGLELEDKYGSHFKHIIMASFQREIMLEIGEEKITCEGYYMDIGAPEMLSLKMLDGSHQALVDPNSILLAASTAKALFGEEDPMNKTVKMDAGPEVQIAGIYEDLPDNASFSEMKFMASWDFYVNRFNLLKRVQWGNSWFQTFVQINDNTDISTVSAAIKNAKRDNIIADNQAKFNPVIFLQPMSNWRLFSLFEDGVITGGRIQYVRLFGIIGIFVLLLACINFMNLSTARSEKRAKEVGVRKTLGSHRRQLINQFFSESFLVTVFALFVALFLVQLVLPSFNEVADKQLSLPLKNNWFVASIVGFSLLTGFFAGLYPALYLSSFQPVKVLKGTFKVGKNALLPRQLLVVTQFTVSVTLIIGTMIVFNQIQYVKNRPIGYDNNNILSFPIQTDKMNGQYEAFKNDLLNTGLIENVAKSESLITATGVTNSGYIWEGKDPNMADEFVTLRVSHDFGEVINWKINQGRDFNKAMATDSMGFVINEAAAKYMGMENPIGQTVKWEGNGDWKIIGVIEDMVTQNPYQPIKQTIFYIDYNRSNWANVKLKPETNMSEAITQIESVFANYDPVNIFDYRFADADYARKFSDEERVGKLSSFFTLLAIIISCLGVFGLAAYMAERRTKEIGIRKVLGASVGSIWQMLSKDFVILVVVACLLAIPIAYYFAQDWLSDFEYRMTISWGIFAVASLGILLITLLTVSFQAVKAALLNPVTALKSE